MQAESIFNNKVAIIVAAGPSLNYEIDNLRIVKEKGLALIFSVGSAINTLMYHKITPDAIIAFDPSDDAIVCKKFIEEDIASIPMIFGSSIGSAVIRSYKGPKTHMLIDKDPISNYFLIDNNGRELERASDAPSVAVVTFELLYKLGFSTILLVGQNLFYKNNLNYAEGIDYQITIDPENGKKLETVIDAYGNQVYTNASFNLMRRQMEFYIKNFVFPS